MKTSKVAVRMKKYIGKLVGLFLSRNLEYASEDEWSSNFDRNAAFNKVYRISEIIDKPYGVSIAYVLQKLDRLINGIVQSTLHRGWRPDQRIVPLKHLGDSIDDAIVYLFITKNLLVKEGLINNKKRVELYCSKCKKEITTENIMYGNNPILCKKCFKEKSK